MRWARHHRTAILVTYSVLAVTAILVLQILDATGHFR